MEARLRGRGGEGTPVRKRFEVVGTGGGRGSVATRSLPGRPPRCLDRVIVREVGRRWKRVEARLRGRGGKGMPRTQPGGAARHAATWSLRAEAAQRGLVATRPLPGEAARRAATRSLRAEAALRRTRRDEVATRGGGSARSDAVARRGGGSERSSPAGCRKDVCRCCRGAVWPCGEVRWRLRTTNELPGEAGSGKAEPRAVALESAAR